MMKLKRASLLGGLVYIISFSLWGIIATLLGSTIESPVEPMTYVWYIGLIIIVLLMVSFTLWYFNDKNIKPSAKEGFLFGLVTVIIALIFDALFTVVLMLLESSFKDPFLYYTNPLFWVTLGILLVTTTMVGRYEGGDSFIYSTN